MTAPTDDTQMSIIKMHDKLYNEYDLYAKIYVIFSDVYLIVAYITYSRMY
jgi:hypothetical protein